MLKWAESQLHRVLRKFLLVSFFLRLLWLKMTQLLQFITVKLENCNCLRFIDSRVYVMNTNRLFIHWRRFSISQLEKQETRQVRVTWPTGFHRVVLWFNGHLLCNNLIACSSSSLSDNSLDIVNRAAGSLQLGDII